MRKIPPATALLLLASLCAAPSARSASSDYNGDGRSDVFWRNADTGANVIWLSANASTPRAMPAMPLQWSVAGEGDFDGDGHSDLFWRNRSTGGNVIWRSGDASMSVNATTLADVRWQVAGVGDFDGDGRADVIWRHLGSGANAIWRSASAALPRAVAQVSDLRWLIAGIGDFNGDGRADLFWRHATTGGNVIWLSADAAQRQAAGGVADAAWQVAAVGDFNADGRSDLFWHNLNSGRNTVWRSGDSATIAGDTEISWQIAASGDFNGDGHADVLWRNFIVGSNTIWRSGNVATSHAMTGVSNLGWGIAPFEAQPSEPLLSIAAVIATAEGNTGARQATFPLRLSHPSVFPVQYDVDAHDSIGTPAAPPASGGIDYVGASLTGQIAPGNLSSTVGITILGDGVPEPNESFEVVVYAATGARILWDLGLGIIQNDDANTLWIAPAATWEGNSGLRPMRFQIRLSRPATVPVSFNLATAQLPPDIFSATADVDYISRSQTGVLIPAGATAATFDVAIVGDVLREPLGEAFLVNVSNVTSGVLPTLVSARGFIRDDEPPIIP